MRLSKKGFTFIEMIFALVILGIIAKYGVEFLAQAYRNYLYTEITDKLANTSSTAVEFIAKRLEYRIRPSVIVRKGNTEADFRSLEGFGSNAEDYNVLEWIGYDIDGFRGGGDAKPMWSGIIDKKASLDDGGHIITPGSDLDKVDALISSLSGGDSSIDDAAIYLFAAENDVNSSFGWHGGSAISDQHLNFAMHPITKFDEKTFSPGPNASGSATSFSDLFDDIKAKGKWDARYYLAWSAYAVKLEDNGSLMFYYNYQPWQGEKYSEGNSSVIMEHVNTFKMIQKEGVIKIQVCTTNDDMSGTSTMDIGGFALCKEKTIY